MGRPLRVRVLRDGVSTGILGAGYLDALLRLHGFVLLGERGDDDPDGAAPDAVLVPADSRPPARSADVPLIVIPSWQPDAAEAAGLVADGADDVLPMAELSAGRLEAAVRKAAVRRSRAAVRAEPGWRMWTPAADGLIAAPA